jgi:glycosyltransferase involved in cell wall biosynthesis
MDKDILLSIVIPTKDRYYYLKILILAILKSNKKKFEIIVQDNSKDNNNFIKFLEEVNDDRVKYNYVSHWISVPENFNYGVVQAKGKYVIVLGDDDGILIDQSIEFLEQCFEKNIESVFPLPIVYQWPDNSHSVWESINGSITFNKSSYFNKKINVDKELKKQLSYGFGYGLGKMPRVYQGFVLNKCLKKLNSICGSSFPGPSPDMSNAVGLSSIVKNAIYTNKYLVVSGHSKKSAAGMGGRKEHVAKIKDVTWLPKETADLWIDKIPFFWTGPTIYAESARLALVKTNNQLVDKINYNYLYAILNIYEKKCRQITYLTIKNNNHHLFFKTLKRYFIYFKILLKRSVNFCTNLILYKLTKKYKANDIGEAFDIIIRDFYDNR